MSLFSLKMLTFTAMTVKNVNLYFSIGTVCGKGNLRLLLKPLTFRQRVKGFFISLTLKNLHISDFYYIFAVSKLITIAMITTTILRVEYKDGWGMFRSGVCSELSNYKEFIKKHKEFPMPQNDSLIEREPYDDEYCAFKSIEQFQQWITPIEIKELIKAGCRVLLLDVVSCVIGEFQILYEKGNVVQLKNITELFI